MDVVTAVAAVGSSAIGHDGAAFNKASLVVGIMFIREMSKGGVQERAGLSEAFECLLVDFFTSVDEFVDVEGQEDQGNGYEGRDPNCQLISRERPG